MVTTFLSKILFFHKNLPFEHLHLCTKISTEDFTVIMLFNLKKFPPFWAEHKTIVTAIFCSYNKRYA